MMNGTTSRICTGIEVPCRQAARSICHQPRACFLRYRNLIEKRGITASFDRKHTYRKNHRIAFASVHNSNTKSINLSGSYDDDDDDDINPGSNSLLPEDARNELGPSPELQALSHLQLELLISFLEDRIESRLANSDISNDASNSKNTSNNNIKNRKDINNRTTIRCAAYYRSPQSLPSGKLQLQLVASSDVRETEASQQRKDLILGLPDSNEQYQEAWIVEQPLIVLPDSGGLVLPLAHNSFLVGLLVVERIHPNSTVAFQPPAVSIFGKEDLALIKKVGAALGFAFAVDLRASLERAGNIVRHRQVRELARRVRKPLSTLRTLGTMLAPRLEDGGPERDMTEVILAQGEILHDIVNQLQTALAPISPATAPGGNGVATQISSRRRSMDRWGDNNIDDVGYSRQSHSTPVQQYPALPSSSIGADNYSPAIPSARSTSTSTPPNSSSSSATSAHDVPSVSAPSSTPDEQYQQDEGNGVDAESPSPTATADIAATLLPLLASASNFASVSGITFLVNQPNNNTDIHISATTAPTTPPERETTNQIINILPTTVPIDVIALKRMLGQLLDGVIACAARGDCIEVAIQADAWQGRQPGIIVAVRLLQSLTSIQNDIGSISTLHEDEGRVYVEEFATVSSLARQYDGWLDIKVESVADGGMNEMHNTPPGSLSAALWLPVLSS